MPRRLLLPLLAVAALFVGAACEVDTTVAVNVADDGSGTVTVTVELDPAAAARMPDLDQSLLVADLESAGWSVDGPERTDVGGWRVAASKGFDSPDELPAVLAQVTGPDGPIRDVELRRETSFAKTSYDLTATVDLSGGLDALGDQALRDVLGGTTTGRTPEQLAAELGQPVEDAVSFTFEATLPGGGTDEWTPRLGGAPVTVDASSADRAPMAWLFAFTALLAFAGFAATVFLIVRHNRIHRPPSYVHRPGGSRRPWDG